MGTIVWDAATNSLVERPREVVELRWSPEKGGLTTVLREEPILLINTAKQRRIRQRLVRRDRRRAKRFSTPARPKVIPKELMAANIVRDGVWGGGRAFIIGGGPSLRGFDWSWLSGELVIAVNRAYEFCEPAIIFSMDKRYLQWVLGEHIPGNPYAREQLLNYRKGYKIWMDAGVKDFPAVKSDIYVLPCVGTRVFSKELSEGLGGGANSGYAALNLAYLLGADPIYLLGFDMGGGQDESDEKQAWFHDGYPDNQGKMVFNKFKKNITDIAAPALKEAGVEVVNLSAVSKLECFPKQDITELAEMPKPVIVAYWTEGTGYEAEAQRLAESLRLFGFERDIREVPNLGSWQKNTQFKPLFLRQMLDKHHPHPVVYVDADAVFLRYPNLLREMGDADIAIHYRDKGDGRKELLSGTIYLANTSAAREILDVWEAANNADANIWDQRSLQQVLDPGNSNARRWRIRDLPAEYCAIFDQRMCESPAINHYQASRRLKEEVVT